MQWTNSGFLFMYHKALRIDHLFPKIAPLNTSTTITISGANFVNSETLSCAFDTFLSKARLINSSALECNCSDFGSRIQRVRVSANGQEYSNYLTLQLHDNPNVNYLTITGKFT